MCFERRFQCRRSEALRFSLPLLATIALFAGCVAPMGADPERAPRHKATVEIAPSVTTPVPGGYVSGKLLHALNLGKNHNLEFYEFSPGAYGMRETLSMDDHEAQSVVEHADYASMVAVYRAARPDADLSEIPQALVEADRVVEAATAAAVADAKNVDINVPVNDDTNNEAVAQVSAALDCSTSHSNVAGCFDDGIPTPVPDPPHACSGDAFGDNWGAQWFLNNFCNERNFRECVTNQRVHQSGEKNTRAFLVKEMEGDYANIGHFHGASRKSTHCESSFFLDPFCTTYEFTVQWDFDMQPRQIAIMTSTDGYPSVLKRSWAWSECNHSHMAVLFN